MQEKAHSIEAVIEKHCAFWERSNEQAVLQQVPFVRWRTKPYPLKGGDIVDVQQIVPSEINTAKFLGLRKPIPDLHYGNRIDCVMPLYPQAWMSGIIGCPICASGVSCSALGAEYGDIAQAAEKFSVERAMKSDWYKYLQECTDAIVGHADGKIAASQFHLRGIVDMLAAYFKEDVLCLAVYDYPDMIKQLASKFTELYIETAKSDIQKRGLWRGGNVISWGVYAPGELLSYQVDASNLFSRDMYEDLLLEFDAQIVAEFEYSLIHTHYTGLHVIESLVKIKELGCVQINLDREAVPEWSLDKVMQACKTVQDADKCVLINGELSRDEVQTMLDALKPQGLMMLYWLPEDWNPLDIK
ncbi:MAG: hypothetical protein HN948_06200 [Clostridia bacterium]|jgi:hypothetical protein|nr:hypothetical protein [Clostridia bacterium]MBT7122588.1 hypothetical protein [Clostridia bacterium]